MVLLLVLYMPIWATFNEITGELVGTPNNSQLGTSSNIMITVSDSEYSDTLTAFDITVSNVNDSPTISGTPSTSVYGLIIRLYLLQSILMWGMF